MFEKVNPKHPDKIADRIAGAIVDHAYSMKRDPKIAVEILIGHGTCTILIEADSDLRFDYDEICDIVSRISERDDISVTLKVVPQDPHLADNQKTTLRCGDNGIFKGMPVTNEQSQLTDIAARLYDEYDSDGKYVINNGKLIICQSNAGDELNERYNGDVVNPLGTWTGGIDVDSGATNRKLGSDMGDGVTGGGLHGKDLSKADVSVNIYCHVLAQQTQKPVSLCCAIGDETVNGIPYTEIVEFARGYIMALGGFERFAEWGLIRPR